ncbi:MAG: proline--tRNA ligase [Clostridia bacterium]|nr:proline--tRNA ligase [Clostridia bacterium]
MGNNNNDFVKEITNIDEDFAQWYTDIVIKAELADYTDTKGCIAIRPYGYAIWENIQNYVDSKFKETGVKNTYFPVLIPESLLQKEKDHVEGFAPEVAWVTEAGGEKLDEKLCIRPTSETIISTMYSKWLNSWRDLPFVYNQWCNVLRWEKETRPFLRSREFIWQEGHTVHETAEEAKARTLQMLDVYADVVEKFLAIPVVKGIKTETEKFSGAEETYTIETLMHDGKALQTATSHYFGQNFSKPFEIKFQNREGKEEYAYQTSWGCTTRLIGAIIMAHGDNRGLKLPPKVAPIQAVIVPVAMHKEGVKERAIQLFEQLKKNYRMELDDRDQYSPGYKFNDWEMRGVPVRIEMGPRDIEANKCVVVRRDTAEKIEVSLDEIETKLTDILDDIQTNMYNMVKENTERRTTIARNLEEFQKNINENQGFIKAMWCGNAKCEEKIKELTAAKSRCIPEEQEKVSDVCVCCGEPANTMVIWGRQY